MADIFWFAHRILLVRMGSSIGEMAFQSTLPEKLGLIKFAGSRA
jgi:hypothetical protein